MTRAASRGHLVGRSRELAALLAGLARAAEGSPGAAFVCGESGIGKTRLVAEFASQAARAGARVFVGRCVEMSGGELPYGPIVDALRLLSRSPLREDLAALLAPTHEELGRLLLTPSSDPQCSATAGTTSTAARSRIFELTLELLGRLGDLSPVVVILEDLHWADRTSLDLLGFLIRRLCQQRAAFEDVGGDRVYIVATYRSDELGPDNPLGLAPPELAYRGVVDLLHLTPLTREEMAALLRELLLQEPAPALVDTILARSEGNPYFAQELAADGGDDGGVPDSLRQLVLRRMARLSPDARETLRIAAAIGRRATHTLLAAVCGLSQRRLLRALREAVEHGLITSDGETDSYLFRHAVAQEALYDELLPGERLALHRAIAEALEKDLDPVHRHPVETAELAHHWYAARDPSRALPAAIDAGRAAAKVYAFAEAHRQFERAVSLWSTDAEARALSPIDAVELLREAAEAARYAGAVERAIALVRQARAAVDDTREPARAAVLQERLGRCLWEYGDVAGSLAADEEAARLLDGQPTSAVHARVLAAHATGLMLSGQSPAALQRCAEAIAVSRQVGARAEEGYALTTLGVSRAMVGDVDGGLAALHAARDIVVDVGSLEDICRVYANLTFVLTSAGRLEESLNEAYAGLAMTWALGMSSTAGGAILVNACSTLFLLGRWDEASVLAQDALGQQMAPAFISHLRLTLGDVATATGRFDEAEELLSAAADPSGGSGDLRLVGPVTASRAELALWRGDPGTARRLVEAALPLLDEPDHDQLAARICSLGLRALADAAQQRPVRAQPRGDDERRLGDRLRERAARCVGDERGRVLPELAAYDLLCSAELARWRGHPDAELWSRVEDARRGLGEPYPAAYAAGRCGEALLARKARRQAAAPLSRALRTAVELRAAPLRRSIELLAQGARLTLHTSPAIPRPRSPADTLRLTPREQEVLTLLAAGRTNRQIARALVISEKTASVHVSNILTKLGVANRVEAAAAAHSLRLV
jgi:DNA-binding CsgD family transcriptional regulator/tetratricopeptide (TPR) repeat protein